MFADGRPDELVRGVDIVGTPLVSLTKIVATGDKPEIFNGYCGAESGSVPVSAVAPAILISEMEFAKKETSTDRPPILPPPAHDPEATKGQAAVKKLATLAALLAAFAAAALRLRRAPPGKSARAHRASRARRRPCRPAETDQTLRAMHDEMERARTRLELPGVDKPFYIEYRLLDLDVRSVTASFGALVSSTTARTRFMSVDVRVGDYHLDSSNFISEDGFQGFLGSTGQVGIDRDYNSLRQDLWLATDQAYKAAVTQMSLKQAFLRSLTKPPEIDDFSQAQPLVKVDPRIEPDWTSRNWEDEARAASAVLKNFRQLYGTRVNYYLVYATTYLMTSEGTTIRTSRSLAAIEAALDTQADDGMPLHNYYAVYARAARRPARRGHRIAKALAERRHRTDGAALEPARSRLHRPGAFRRAGRGFGARAGSRAVAFRRAAAAFDDAATSTNHGAHGRPQRMDAAASARACFPPACRSSTIPR